MKRRRIRAFLKPYAAVSTLVGITLHAVSATANESGSKAGEFSWAGFHIGGSFGAGFSMGRGQTLSGGSGFTTKAFDLYPGRFDHPGLSFGAQLGYDWQKGPWVYGVETDLNFLNAYRGPSGLFLTPPSYWPLGVIGYGIESEPSGNYFASFRGRLGFAVDRTLFYVTGGLATGGWRGASRLALFNPAPNAIYYGPLSQSSRMKYAVGAGLEHALDDHWSTRFEYLFVDQALQNQFFGNGAGIQYFSHDRVAAHVFRIGLNYRFPDNPETKKEKTGNAEERNKGEKKTDVENSMEKGTSLRESKDPPEQYNVHGQVTNVVQGYPKFPALYSGPASFRPQGQARAGSIANLFAGVKLWEGGAIYLNPEIDAGFGLSNSTGAAAYVNGAVTKVGRAAPYVRFQRYFLRQIIGLDTDSKQNDSDVGSYNEVLESTQNQLSGKVSRDRIILTIGKFAVPDVFDDNVYAHDPNTGFLNLAVNTLGAFDYAADAWGYTYGAALEWKQNWWTARGGIFQLSQVPNGPSIEPAFLRQFMGVAEFEARYNLFGQPGAIKFLAYGDDGYMAKFDDVIALALATGNLPPSVNTLRRRHLKIGGGVNIKQQLVPNLGFFLRASMADGRYETVDFTDIDRSLTFGLVAAGEFWGRPKDEIGAAAVFSGLTGSHVRYFALGGIGAYIGDGALTYGGEHVFEAYYKLNVMNGVQLTADYQLLQNPAHNLDRGPVSVFGLRLHGEF
jgi:high affinity Mn2+ porin